jgi:hypothetical protein
MPGLWRDASATRLWIDAGDSRRCVNLRVDSSSTTGRRRSMDTLDFKTVDYTDGRLAA